MNLSSALSIVLFALVFTGVARSSDPQLQQICTNAGMCLLAVRRSGLSGRGLISNHINYVNARFDTAYRRNGHRASSAAARPVKDWLT
jgi:hypothetical protein